LSIPAADRLKGILSEGQYKAVRFAMQPADAGQVTLNMFLVGEIPDGETVFSEKGISLLMDKDTAEVMEGAEVDLVKEGEDEHFVLNGALAGGCACGANHDEAGCGCGCSDEAGVDQHDA
jgi:iron-sulfur cluster assembly protein